MATTTVHGWSPASEDDEDVHVSQDIYFMTQINPLPSSNGPLLGSTCPPLDTNHAGQKTCPLTHQSQLILSAPLTCFPPSPMAPSSDRRAQRNRSRDPSWIPRPRNAFIIFRCEYSREHTQSAQEQEEDSDFTNPTAKTLSKRAAEAWKQLSATEKDQYKVLADREREEHARLYPHYRFRPMRRRTSATKKTFHEHPHDGAGSVGHIVDASTHFPSVLAPAAQDLRDKARRIPPPCSKSWQGAQPSEILSHRRSSSVPAAESLPIPTVVPAYHRDRRSNSVSERTNVSFIPPGWHLTATPVVDLSSCSIGSQGVISESPKVEYTYSITPYSSSPKVASRFNFPPEDYQKQPFMPSPLATVTSSLIGWNGEFGPPSPSASAYTASSQGDVPSSSPCPVADVCAPPDQRKANTAFQPLCEPVIGMFANAFVSGVHSSYEDLERAQALEAYSIGLHNYDLLSFPEYSSIDTSLEDELAALLFPEPPLGS
ncbi:hypothetical protein BS17DRAFT_772555 [Gyrodon lividus]|nr:hypothetical protein BS17DRAFT_772555 [Gyrodon lividus]